jgi:hypothetical protein
MDSAPPILIAINHDDSYAEYVGSTADARQFFVTTPFVPALHGEAGREFLAVYLFDRDGKLLEARIDDLGTRKEVDREHVRSLIASRPAELGSVDYGRIQVQPFQIGRFGTIFGLVVRPPSDVQDDWWAEVQPGNYMAFHEPWDSGEYDT